MPYHMSKSRMTSETWARIAENPEDRMVASKAGAKEYGGHMVGYWYTTGRQDIVALAYMPDMATAGAMDVAIYGSGAFLDYDNVWLFSVDDMKQVMHRLGELPSLHNYRAPGAK